MNHEAVHLANADVANSRDLRWRQFFGGKPPQTEEHPETILYNYLTVPRLQCAALVLRRRGDIHGNLDGGGHWPGPERL